MIRKLLFLVLACGIFIISCTKDITVPKQASIPVLPTTPYDYVNLRLPNGVFVVQNSFVIENGMGNGENIFIDPNTFVNINNDAATLGRVLFYDKQLSLNNTISCGSCHHQDKAFSDGQKLSPGFQGKHTARNSMSFQNPIAQRNLFWDSRSFSLADLSLRPIQNHIEMGMEDLNKLAEKLSKVDYYPELFTKAFGSAEITPDRISQGITQFVSSITTADSKFDKAINNGTAQLSSMEAMGMNIFNSNKAKCASCHAGNNFAAADGPFDPYGGGGDNSGNTNLKGTTNIGLDLVTQDAGRKEGSFKIPSLRNVELTAPYMHDGRFKTLGEVIDHYSHGVKNNSNLDPKFRDANGEVLKLNFTQLEKQALIAFLNTLTDEQMITDPKYSDPFKN